MSVDTYEPSTRPSPHDRWRVEATLLGADETSLATTEGLLADLEAHHRATYEHSLRVGPLALRLGALHPELDGLPAGSLLLAATLHDIGKIYTPESILDKKGGLTDDERGIIKSHPLDGHEILMNAGLPLEAGAIVLHHTFQPDPYPSPEEIPEPDPQLPDRFVRLLPAMGKVIALADFYDSSHRGDSGHVPSPEKIQENIYGAYPDHMDILEQAYGEGIFS